MAMPDVPGTAKQSIQHDNSSGAKFEKPRTQFAMAKKKKPGKTTDDERSSSKPPRTTGAAKKTKPRSEGLAANRLAPLTGLARDLYLQVLNRIAFQDYQECCLVDTLAEKLGKTPGRLKPAIRKLVELGYVTLEGDVYPIIFPTVEALRHQDPRLSEKEARRILAKARRA